MCGIAGFVSRPINQGGGLDTLQRMTRSAASRGPDAEGYWSSGDGRVHLGHRRLAIIDLTPSGAQPMRSPDGRFTLTFNGEIYNYRELRRELEGCGCRFRGASDTEVLLEAIRHWGVRTALPRLNGMFAFAVWDEQTGELWLARDRFGEKPLYYGWHGGTLLFGSVLKMLATHPDFRREIDPVARARYLRLNDVPSPLSIFRNTWKMPPGHFLCCRLEEPPGETEPYWELRSEIARQRLVRADLTGAAITDALDAKLRRAVADRMISDVPLGAFLSGGIDSSTIVTLMQAQSSRAIKTFTIGFNEESYNEAQDAARIARHLGTDHHELYLSSRECLEIVPALAQHYDEPFADASQIPTLLVSQFTRKHVTVALSGDAGDELFGGYNRYVWSSRIWPRLRAMPIPLRRLIAKGMSSISPAGWERAARVASPLLPERFRVRGAGEKIHKLAAAMHARTLDELYGSFVSMWPQPSAVLRENTGVGFDELMLPEAPAEIGEIERLMFYDAMTYLSDDILAKVDRASMASSLEARVPFLDNEVVAFAWSLPFEAKIHNGVGKQPLRAVLKRYVPEELFERPKMGFGVPIGEWLRGPLRDWAESALEPARLGESGLRAEVVRRCWQEHLSGRRNNQYLLWNVIMFEEWRRTWL